LRQKVQARRIHARGTIVAEVAAADIIRIDHDDIGLRRMLNSGSGQSQNQSDFYD
jgi:hypothetical protein